MNSPLYVYTLLLAGLLGLTADSRAAEEADAGPDDTIRYQLIMPEEKTPESIKPNEPNPFSKVAGAEEEEASSEENSVREILMSMPVTGLSSDAHGGTRVMLGPIKLERGTIVPPVLPEQSVTLRVNAVSESALELIWVEKKNTGLPPRTLIVPFDVRPRVRQKMAGFGVQPQAKKESSGYITLEPQRDSPVQKTAGTPSAVPSTPAPQQASSPAAAPPAEADSKDANHPANMLMNLLMGKPVPAEQPAPKE